MKVPNTILQNKSVASLVSLKTGGNADWFSRGLNLENIVEACQWGQDNGHSITLIGEGSNMLPSDQGIRGLTIQNRVQTICIEGKKVTATCGSRFQDLFLKCAQANLTGFEYAVGIPGSIGGAMVSNAGSYRSNISSHLQRIEIFFEGRRQWVDPEWMKFSYRDSFLRQNKESLCILLQAEFLLDFDDPKNIYDRARDYQRQRISKQPPGASAGSFFKNVNHFELAQTLEELPKGLKESGVIPAGFLLEKIGIGGKVYQGAVFSGRHANFMMNIGGASATSIRSLAYYAKERIFNFFGIILEEEVLYIGDWSTWKQEKISFNTSFLSFMLVVALNL